MKIIKLSEKYLEETVKLVHTAFPEEEDIYSDKELKAAVHEDSFKEYKYQDPDIISLEYFIAINENDNVIGIIGLYSLKADYEEAYWLGWYCIDPKHRGKGIGLTLLNFAISEAKKRGKKYLRLYTSDDPGEAKAQKVYEKSGFHITRIEKKDGYEIFYREKKL